MTALSDPFHRPINYLRISVTDRCNLRCIYCLPSEGVSLLPQSDILTYEEIARLAGLAVELGVNKVRLTGGEPLVRTGLSELISLLCRIKDIDDISLTTNGILLKDYAAELKQAGLKRVNISLDSLNRGKFKRITRYDKLNEVLRGIKEAKDCGLAPVKVNMVVIKGVNDDEVVDFARLSVTDGWHIRFIELMPFVSDNPPDGHSVGGKVNLNPAFMSAEEIKERLKELGNLEPSLPITGNGPARYYRLPGAAGTVGFIAPISQHFCFNCNRLRLTAEGRLRPCLLSDKEVDLRQSLRGGASSSDLQKIITDTIKSKPRQHGLSRGGGSKKRLMSQLGG
jgi:GTP 3',8-cyclase